MRLAIVAASLPVGGTGGQADGKRGHALRAVIARFDLNKDGTLDQGERAAMQKAKFDRLDNNHDRACSIAAASTSVAVGIVVMAGVVTIATSPSRYAAARVEPAWT